MQKAILIAALSMTANLAQGPQGTENRRVQVISEPPLAMTAPGNFAFVNAEMGFEASLVKGAPFTGDFVTESTQTLADGNRIKNSNTTAYARDGEGRTRRELTIEGIGPFAGGESHKTIFIHDPVARIDYILDPQLKTARKINLGTALSKTSSAKEGDAVYFNRRVEGPQVAGVKETVIIERGVSEAKDVTVERSGAVSVMAERMPLPPGIVMQGEAGAVIAHKIQIGEGPAANANFKNEPLGKRVIEGVEADGTRSTVTIPAGQVGNERALDTVSERWFSEELKTMVLTTRKDPRTGESAYRLTNLRRGEPAPQLFEVPSDYKLIEETNRGMIRMRVDKPR